MILLNWTACGCTIRFDVILDNVGEDTEEWAMRLLKPWSGAKYVTLVSPLLLNTDSMGLLDGSLHAGLTLHNKAFQVNMNRLNDSVQKLSSLNAHESVFVMNWSVWVGIPEQRCHV